ncbi:MAG: chemotaxis protein CheX [Acidobacteriota bacterium]|nr:chemotaxis protein CheX [Acidobacteriota bacterium]MDQ7088951.1 chemotaxis protein CheX [Acidobacteriota bacterium]
MTRACLEMDVASIVEESFREVVETMFALPVESMEPAGVEDPAVVGMIGLAGSEFHGLLQVHCTRAAARRLAAALLGGEEMLDDPAMISDSLGELANMLGGSVKQRVDSTGNKVEISLPSVLEGQFETHDARGSERSEKAFRVDGEPVLVCFVREIQAAD